MKIGFIGLGIMGRPMAKRLLDAGHELSIVAHKSPLPADLMDGGAMACASMKEVAARSDCVILMVPDTPEVESALFSAEGVAAGLSGGTTVVDMSSIDPISTRAFAEKIEAMGCDYLDAPVSGGEVGAQAGTLTIMVGGKVEVFERMRPVFEAMGKNITLVGAVGAGQTTKIANQIIVALNIEAVAEALLFAAKCGVDPARVREALLGGFAASRVLEVHGERMINRTFDPGFRIRLHQKDLRLALANARVLGISLPHTASAQQLFTACVAQGGSDWDHSAMVKALELLADHAVA